MPARQLQLSRPLDLDRSLSVLVRGRRDPSTQRDADGVWWRAMRSPVGPTTLRICVAHDQLRLEAFGPGAEWALHIGPDLVGHHDNLDGFQPDGVVAALHRKLPGMRILKAHTVLQCLVLVILEQKVVGKQAWQGYHGLYRRLGEPAPGPRPLVLPPDPAALAALPYYEMHGMGIERRRAETILFAAKRAKRLAELPELPLGLAKQRLGAFRGIGPWSVAELARVALGDADAISVGDYHLPKVVAYNLGAPAEADSADDARMLELLAPYAGHRGRVQRLIEAGGKSPPRRGPRLAPIDLRWR